MIQKILRLYVGNCESTFDSLNDLACTILPQVHLFSSKAFYSL